MDKLREQAIIQHRATAAAAAASAAPAKGVAHTMDSRYTHQVITTNFIAAKQQYLRKHFSPKAPYRLFLVLFLIFYPLITLIFVSIGDTNMPVAVGVLSMVFLVIFVPVCKALVNISLSRYRRSGSVKEIIVLLFLFIPVISLSLPLLIAFESWLFINETCVGCCILAIPLCIVVTMYFSMAFRYPAFVSLIPGTVKVPPADGYRMMDPYCLEVVPTGVKLGKDVGKGEGKDIGKADGKERNYEKFAAVLMCSGVIWDYEKLPGGELKMPFSPVPLTRWEAYLVRPDSYILVQLDGNVGVHLSRDDYLYLRVPVTHFMLCHRIAERLKASYEDYFEGNKDLAIWKLSTRWDRIRR